ncbi:MAG: NYN domain-containing protein [Acidimicrobiales bacterium]
MGASEHDHVVLAASGRTAFYAGLAWPGQQVRVGHGPDGADKAILDTIDVRHVASTYRRVVVASGDHIFAPLVDRLRAEGLVVEVVAPTRGIARAMRISAGRLRHFDVLPEAETFELAS